MNFGKVDDPTIIDFSIPVDDSATLKVLNNGADDSFEVYIGCAKWNKTDLKGFYPKGTKDELTYYSRQFNSIEMNSVFYNMPEAGQVLKWKNKTPEGFKFFPKITQSISHMRRLSNVEELTSIYCDAISHFEEKLGMCFLQLHENFGVNSYDKLKAFITDFPRVIPLAVEVRGKEWYRDKDIWGEYCRFLETQHTTNIIVDTAGRRDMMHMRLTTPIAFIRFVGCNVDQIDFRRIDNWVERIVQWKETGLKQLCFFIHQNVEKSSPLFSAYLIEKLNNRLNIRLHIPEVASGKTKLF
ncbi:MAG: DUF72 domain-containing protein [Proteiniphilum sp.]|jgi:uncharacterized protein YecE (DUF72 family)|nr:DUF72 domain-containing protein [Proteiniphilum sp.]